MEFEPKGHDGKGVKTHKPAALDGQTFLVPLNGVPLKPGTTVSVEVDGNGMVFAAYDEPLDPDYPHKRIVLDDDALDALTRGATYDRTVHKHAGERPRERNKGGRTDG